MKCLHRRQSKPQSDRAITHSRPQFTMEVEPITVRSSCTIVLLLLLSALSQPLCAQSALEGRQQHTAEALEHVRDGELGKALDAIALAIDIPVDIPLSTDDGLSRAAGGLSRALTQSDADERYELLHDWTLPTSDRPSVRLLTTIVPQDAPPKAFAREIGERPRDDTFAVAEVGGVRGLFCSGWTLVKAAEETGRLRRLITEIEPLVEQQTTGAKTLLLLAQLADRRTDIATATSGLESHLNQIRDYKANDRDVLSEVQAHALAVAAAALEHEELRPTAETLFAALVDSSLGGASPRLRPFLRVAHAIAVQKTRGESEPTVLYQNRLKYWIPVSGSSAADVATGAVPAMWLTHEDHILHVAGTGQDALLFRYPLTGEFDFICEAQEGGAMGTDGGLLYGGLQFEALGSNNRLTVWDADGEHFVTRPCPFVRHENQPVFNRVTIRTKGDSAQFLSNLHPMWTDSLGHTSPWLGLRSHGENRPVFRNLKLTGDPIIPREVQLTAGDQLRGWQSAYFSESQPTFHAGGVLSEERGTISAPDSEQGTPEVAVATESPGNVTFVWQISDGVVSAGKADKPTEGVRHSLLRYQRPLLAGESIRYEFFYEPGVKEVHPAVGRMAFLLEPNGIRVRWLTSGDSDWTGLRPENALLEPLNRRGPRTLPLKENDWNAALVSLAEGRLQITLNDELVYERAVDFDGDLTFGLYRDANHSDVQVRNVTMTGDWPEDVPEECLANPAVVDDPEVATTDRRVSLDLIGDRTIAENVEAVRRHAMKLPSEQRFNYLKEWVLPSKAHATTRLSGAFSPVDPPPPELLPVISPGSAKPGFHAVSPSRGEQSETPASTVSTQITADAGLYPINAGDARPQNSVLVAPAFDLLDTAKQIGRLAELREQVAALPDSFDPLEVRARAALLSMIGLEQEDQAAANQAADRLYELLPEQTPTSLDAMWPETLATYRAFARFGHNESLAEVLKAIYQQRSMRLQPPGIEFWHTHMHDLMSRLQHRLLAKGDASYEAPTGLEQWIPVLRLRALSRGKGSAAARWHRTEVDEVHHVSGHQEEYLFYRSPLRGNFEVTCEIGGSSTTQILAGGRFHGPGGAHDVFETGSFRRGIISRDKIPEAFSKMDKWVTYRVAVRNNRYTVSIHGRPVHENELPEHADPWFGIHGWFRNPARVRDVRISGAPIIPKEVLLSATPDLDGWVPYFDEWVGDETTPWYYSPDPASGGIITGRLRAALAGTAFESLLSYQRPLVENGSISFEFFYEPGTSLTHPALDRIAFLLRPEGVRLHWITDGPYERALISPDNEFLPDSATPSGPLSLREGDWNHAQLNLEGRQLLLEINGQPALTYELAPNNRRTFGLFHFAGESAVRVRNIIMRGDWPRTIPESARQELASPIVPRLDAERDQLARVFEHSFATDGLDDRYFTIHDPKGGALVQQTLLGVRVSRQALNTWTGTDIRSPFILRGDFDVETEFEGFAHEGEKSAAAILQIRFDDERQPHSRIARNRLLHDQRQALQASKSLLNPDGSRDYDTTTVSYEGTSGRMRIARRGSTVYCLVAEGDSHNYRLFGTHEVTARDTLPDGIWLHAVANGNAAVHVTWKNLRIAAEELLVAPQQPPQTEIFVMNADGSNLRAITKEVTADYGKGSPDWSPDGKQIAFDIYTGRSSTSKCYLINVDGTGLVDLGLGLMPNFSPDGQRLAFTWSGQGMSLMALDGTNREVLTEEGWGAQWSPDGRWVAYQSSARIDGQYRANITIIDVDTREKRVILEGDQADRYSQILWNMEWSPDSQYICFKGRLANRSGNDYETVITSIAGSSSAFRIITDETTDTDFGWHPDGRRILLAKISPKHGGMKLFIYDLDTGTMELLPTQPLDTPNSSGVWSPDGSQIAFVARPSIEPVPWEPPSE